MPLSGGLLSNKEGNYAPALLATFTFADGSTLHASTHPLNTAEGGTQYAGADYLARIDSQDIQQVQARSEQGVDRISDVSLKLYNADQFLLINYELAVGKGFKGAILQLALVLIDIDPSTGNYVFTNDSPAPYKFTGICDAPAQAPAGGQFLNIRATTAHNLALVDLPILRVQQRCVNVFPRNPAERLAGATDMSSWQWGCGYNPDQTGTDPEIGGDCRRGNVTGAGATDPVSGQVIADAQGNYIVCNYTKADCVLRGMYSKDSLNRNTGRFTAIQWAPQVRETQAKNYVQGKNITVFSMRNDAIYVQRPYALLYGTQWLKNPIIANVLGSGNDTKSEVVLCSGDIGPGGVDTVVVNGIIIPPNGAGVDANERWNFLDQNVGNSTHTGSRNGIVNSDTSYDSQGDPYGGLATIETVVHTELAQSNGLPSIQIRVHGPKLVRYASIASYVNGVITLPTGVANTNIAGNPPFTVVVFGCSLPAANGTWNLTNWTFGPPGTITLTGGPGGIGTGGYIRYTPYDPSGANNAWVIYDLLTWANYSFAELDTPSFIAAAAFCDTSISYTDLRGNTQNHARFICQFALENLTKANEVIQSVLRSFNAQLVPNSDTGLLQLFIRQTLADQQPAAVPGSNYNTAILSVTAANATANGFVAYLIDESVILQDGKGTPQMEGPYCLPNAQSPNAISFPFQDADNGFQDDSISVVDPDDVARAAGYQLGGAQIPAGYTVRGISSFDQGIRIANTILAENFRGNPRLDTRGSYFFQVTTTVRLEHLRVGHIVLFRYQALSLQPGTQLQSPPGTGISGILCRVEAIKPASNYERMTVTLRWHDDRWYTDLYGQRGTPGYSDPRQALPDRLPLPWKPFAQQPIASDSMYVSSEWSFSVAQSYVTSADGSPIAQLAIGGCPPVNSFTTGTGRVQPPLMNIQAVTANTGGAIAGNQRIVMAIAAQDANGKWSQLSAFTSVTVPSGTNTNTVTTPNISWDTTNTAAWVLFAGRGHHSLSAQASGTGTTPATITLTALNVATYGAPDPMSYSILPEVKRVIHGGVWGDVCTAVSSNADGTGTITFATAPTTHQFQQTNSTIGYDLTVIANANGSTAAIPIADFHVIDNTGGIYTVSPDPGLVDLGQVLGTGIPVGTVFVLRAFPSTITPTTIGDANFVNAYNAPGISGLASNAEVGNRVRIIAGTGRGQERSIISNTPTVLTIDRPWTTLPDTTSRFIVEEGVWQDQPYAQQSASSLTPSPPPIVATLNLDNYRGQTVLVRCLIADQQNNNSVSRWSPLREAYIWGAQGSRVVTANDTQKTTDGVVLINTSGISGSTTTLGAAITDTTGTSGTVASGTNVVNGTYIKIDSEIFYVRSGGGTVNLTWDRGQLGTTAATHANGATVNLPGQLLFTLLPISKLPNQGLIVKKTSTDIHYVTVQTDPADTFDGSSTTVLLADNTSARGTLTLKAPGA